MGVFADSRASSGSSSCKNCGVKSGVDSTLKNSASRSIILRSSRILPGPFRFTETKRNLSPILGLEGYRRIAAQCRENGIALPVVAIGGITAGDIDALLATGIAGIALSGTLLRADDPAAETRKIIEILKKYKP